MKKFKIIIFSTIFIFVLINKAFAENNTDAATVYKITMTYLELCESGSTDSTCLNPLVIGTGDSGPIDIASTTAGAAAGNYGDFKKVPFGKSYSYYQVTMKREITIAGSVSDGAKTCYTDGDNESNYSENIEGKAAAGASDITVFMAMISASLGSDVNSATAADGSGTSRAAGTVTAGDGWLEKRGAFTKPIKLEAGRIPTLILAFGTTSALGYMGATNGCATGGGESQGLYGAKPDVTATVRY